MLLKKRSPNNIFKKNHVPSNMWSSASHKKQRNVSAFLPENVWQKRHVFDGNVSGNPSRACEIPSPLPSVNVNSRPDKNKKTKGRLISIILMNQDLPLILISPTLGKSLGLLSKFLHESVDASMSEDS